VILWDFCFSDDVIYFLSGKSRAMAFLGGSEAIFSLYLPPGLGGVIIQSSNSPTGLYSSWLAYDSL
jgi:hypothetical protein